MLDDIDQRNDVETTILNVGVRKHALMQLDPVKPPTSFDQRSAGFNAISVNATSPSQGNKQARPSADIEPCLRTGRSLKNPVQKPAHLKGPGILGGFIPLVFELLIKSNQLLDIR